MVPKRPRSTRSGTAKRNVKAERSTAPSLEDWIDLVREMTTAGTASQARAIYGRVRKKGAAWKLPVEFIEGPKAKLPEQMARVTAAQKKMTELIHERLAELDDEDPLVTELESLEDEINDS